MRNIRVVLTCAALLVLLGGCASTGGFPADPKDQALWYVVKAERQAKNGDFEKVAYMLTEAVSRPGGVDAAKEFLTKSPNIKSKLSEYLQQGIEKATNKEEINNIAMYIYALGKENIIQDYDRISKLLEAKVSTGNASGEVKWLLGDDISNLPILGSQKEQQLIFDRTLDAMSDRKRPKGMAKALADYLSKPGRSESDLNWAKQKLWKSNPHRAELQELKILFPDLVNSKLAELTIHVQVTVSPSDRLMEEDLKEKLTKISSHFIVLKNGEQGNDKTIKVTIEKLRSEERQLPSQSQTISYARHEVDMVSAVLLMPRNASYVYEWSRGGVELEYGYVVRVSQNNKVLLDELMRDTLTEKFVSCSNRRVVNIFGGAERADFVANSDMSSKCSGSTSSIPSIQDMKNRVLTLLTEKIVSAEPLSARREN